MAYPYIGEPLAEAESADISQSRSVTTTPEEPLLARIEWQWHPASRLLIARGVLRDGRSYQIGFPLGQVTVLFGREAALEGCALPPVVSGWGAESVDGVLGRLRKAVKRRPLRRALKKVTRKLGRKVGAAARGIGKVARRIAPVALAAGAIALPAVGGPGLAAWAAAGKASKLIDQVKAGKRRPRDVRQAKNVLRNVRALPGLAQRDPTARMLLQALRSIP